MRVFNFIVACVTLIVFSGLPTWAAEIQVAGYNPNNSEVSESKFYNFGEPFISLRGEIVQGDLEKLKTAAQQLAEADVPIVLKLNSPGGDVVEALEIASFVREAWITTLIQGRISGVGDNDRSIVTCDSACAIIFLAGIDRRYGSSNSRAYALDDPYLIPLQYKVDVGTGHFTKYILGDEAPDFKMESIPVLGLHRPYLVPELNSILSAKEAQDIYKVLETQVRSALDLYDMPDDLIEVMMRTSSASIERIGSDALFAQMSPMVPWFDEWLLANCGALSNDEVVDLASIKLDKKMTDLGFDSSETRFSASYVRFLEQREAEIEHCRSNAFLEHQSQYLQSER